MLVMASSNDPVKSLENSCCANIVIAIWTGLKPGLHIVVTVTEQCFKEDFNALDLSIDNKYFLREIDIYDHYYHMETKP